LDIHRQVWDGTATSLVLLLQIFQAAKVVADQAVVLLALAVRRHLAHNGFGDRFHHRHTLTMQNVGLPQLDDDLLRLETISRNS
jgi:hypothetical protein